eukprot:2896725-Rhodomonas_salina.1
MHSSDELILPGQAQSESPVLPTEVSPSSGNRMRTDSGRSLPGAFPAFLEDYAADDAEDELQDVLFSSEIESGGAGAEMRVRRVCDGINLLAERGKSLRFDAATKYFTVVDGPLFETEFAELKATRSIPLWCSVVFSVLMSILLLPGAKKAQQQERIFAQMYRNYVIVQGRAPETLSKRRLGLTLRMTRPGERWGATGTVFATKNANIPLPSVGIQHHASQVSSPIMIFLTDARF